MSREPSIDHLRVAMTALVVFHHAAITYGAAGGWYLYETPRGSSPALTLFVTVNQTFLMGVFFLVAGYLTPASYERKGARRFATDRLWRLGVPLLVFRFALDPFTVALAQAHDPTALLSYWRWLVAHGRFSSGPLWFAEALLIFAAAYVLSQVGARPVARTDRRLPSHRTILVSAVAVGGAAFLLRLVFPVGMTVGNLQVGYFASYVFLFAVGVMAARGLWLERVTPRLAAPWLAVSALALLTLLISVRVAGPTGYAGGWTVEAAIYAWFEPFFAWGVILGLLCLFHARLNRPARWASFLSARAYTVYVIHPPLLVGLALALDKWDAAGPAKAAFVGALACCACVVAGSAILAIPGARRVL